LLLVKQAGPDSTIAKAVGRDWKGKFSLFIYVCAVVVAFVSAQMSLTIYTLVAIIWFIPDRRIERVLLEREN
jgi:hypothetical protein